MTKSRGILKPRHRWTEGEIKILSSSYESTPTAEIAKRLNMSVARVYSKAEALGLTKSDSYLASPSACRLRRGDSVGADFRFQPGHKTWNSGLKGWDAGGRSAVTRFKPGSAPSNRRHVGCIRTNSEGYLDIKVSEGKNKWVPLHRWVWKLAHGEFPGRNEVIAFKDGDPQNCLLGNLELLTRQQNMLRNTVHNLPKPVAELVQLRGALNRKINNLIKRNDQP